MSIDEVRSLVAERQRYDDWLTALDARRAETPAKVYERVRGDYDARRTEVLQRLHTHVESLDSLSGELTVQVQELSTRLEALEEQRVEAMIRNAVGEYDNARWETLRQDVEQEINKLTDDRALVEMELAEIRELLEQARPPVVPVAEVVPEPEPVSEPVLEPAPEPVVMFELPTVDAHPDVAEPQPPAPPVEGLFPDLVEPSLAAVPPVEVAPALELLPPAPPTMPQFAGAEVDDALAMFAETPVQPMAAIPEQPFVVPADAPDTMREIDIDVEFDLPDTEIMPMASSPSATAASAPIDPFDDLAFLRSVIEPSGSQPIIPATLTPPSLPSASATAEPAKTLRCTECGTMNLPTEWYCERCGGELAAF